MGTTPVVIGDTFSTTTVNTGSTSGTVDIPSGAADGDLILISLGGYASWSGDFDGDGYTEIYTHSSVSIYAKRAAGTEGTTASFANKNTNQYVLSVSCLIQEGTWYDTGDLTDTIVSAGVSGSLNAPELTTGWGDVEALWCAQGWVNYGSLGTLTGWTDGSGAFQGSPLFIYHRLAIRESDPISGTQDPGTFSGSGTGENSNTFAIRGYQPPAAGPGLFFGPGF